MSIANDHQANGLSAELDFSDFECEHFRSMLARHANSSGQLRRRLRNELVEYLRFSLDATKLTNELISWCVSHASPDRSDIAIDILSQLGESFFHFAYQYLINDICSWNYMYSQRAYEPNDDYWYILLRSVARLEIDENKRLRLITMCSGASSRGVLEGVLEALSDLGTESAMDHIRPFVNHEDRFVAELADELLDEG